jgi:hypothetical protein
MRAWLIVVSLAGASTAYAQAQIVPADGIKGAEKTDVPTFNPFLGVTATLSLTSNSNVVGQVDGFSTLFGLGVTGGADYVKDKHLLRTSLSINESFARTPVIDEFIKTNDVVKLEGIYNYFLTKNFGAFGRLSLTTSLLPADDVRGELTTWVEKNPAGPIPLKMNSLRQRLADPFKPFTINESAGGFAELIRKEKISISLRAGLGGRHTFADSVLLIDDDDATPEVELLRLANVHQLGFEAFAGLVGKTKDSRASYKAGLSVLVPFVNNDDFDRSAVDLTRVGFEGSVTFNVYSWMGLQYTIAITRDPQLFPKGNELTQLQNTLLLTFNFTLVKKQEKKAEPTKEQLELEAEKKRADEAEKRALEAEKKLQEQATPPAPAPEPTPPTEPTTPPGQ